MTGDQIGWFRFRLIRNERLKGPPSTWVLGEDSLTARNATQWQWWWRGKAKLRLPHEPAPGDPGDMGAVWWQDIRSIGRWGRHYAARAARGGFLNIHTSQATIASADGPVDIRMVTGIEFSARATTYSLTRFGGQFLAWAVHDNHLCVDNANHLTLEKKKEESYDLGLLQP